MSQISKPDIKISTLKDVRAIEQIAVEDIDLPRSTYEVLRAGAREYGDRIALRYLPSGQVDEESVTFSYGQLLQKINQTANAFTSLGVEAGTVVSMLLPNLPQTHFTIWGAEAAGIFNPINPLLEAGHIAAILREAESRVLVTLSPAADPENWRKVMAVKAEVPSLKYILTVDFPGSSAGSDHLTADVLDFDQLIAQQKGDSLSSKRLIQGDDIASYFHTGGTTGTPKLAPHSHFNEVFGSYQMLMALNPEGHVRALCGLPLFHVNAVFVTGLTPWMVGGEVILGTVAGYRSPELIKNFWALVEKYQITYFSAVPTILSMLLEVPSAGHDLSSLDVAVCGAAPLSQELLRKFEDRTGIVLVEGYGQTEGTCASSVNPKYGERRVGSVGLPLPHCKVRIVEVDEGGRAVRDCKPNESGVIAISGPNVFSGYKQLAQNEGQWVAEGWFNTGDLGRLDDDGYLWLTGRSKDLIIRGGHNIDPQMIEEVFYQNDKVAEAAAIGKPDKRVGELPVVYIQLARQAAATAEEMLAYAAEHIHERAAVPKEVHFIDTMPVTAVGKIYKPELRNRLIREQALAELEGVLSCAFDVSVEIDKKFGQCVTVTAPGYTHQEIIDTLGDYSYRLVVEKQ